MKKSPLAGLILASVFSAETYAASLEERVKVLEDELMLARDEVAELEHSADRKIEISGYTDIEYHNSSQTGKEPGFRLHHMSLFFKKKIADKWRFFSEIEYEDAPKFEGAGEPQPAPALGEVLDDAKGKIFVEAVNIDFLYSTEASFRAGRFFTPAGIWSIDHYPPFVPTQERPQHIRKIFPQVVDGAMMYGSLKIGENFLNYDLYTGNGEGNIGKQDNNSEKALGLRLNATLPLLDHFELGVTGYKDTLNSGSDVEKMAVGAHVKVKHHGITFQSEYAKADYEPIAAAKYEASGFYGQILYDLNSWTFGYRHDVFEKDNTTPLSSEITMDGVFVNYQVSKDIVLKLERYSVDPEDNTAEDYDKTIASLVVYLGN